MEITKENIEIILYDYAEGNLSEQERKQTEQYLALHPEYAEWLNEYDPLLTIPVERKMVFDRKDEVIGQITARKRPNIVLISKYVKWISATAAAIALFVVIKGYNNFLNNEFAVQDDKNLALNGDFAEKNKSLTNEYQCKKENEKSFEKEDVSFGANKVSFHVSEMTFGRSKATFGDNETTLDVNQSADDENQTVMTMNLKNDSEEINNDVRGENADIIPQNAESEEYYDDFVFNSDEPKENFAEYEDYDYRIIFFNNKPSLWKRFQRWLGLV